MEKADRAFVYFSPEVVAHKKLEPVSPEEVKQAFGTPNVEVFTESSEVKSRLLNMDWEGKTLLMMSSGNFDGIDFEDLGRQIASALL
jgi:UDP-N-acetylmuramate: L-alanyl-gamma-D-glutamyl-meso-diaminopimelate ligase